MAVELSDGVQLSVIVPVKENVDFGCGVSVDVAVGEGVCVNESVEVLVGVGIQTGGVWVPVDSMDTYRTLGAIDNRAIDRNGFYLFSIFYCSIALAVPPEPPPQSIRFANRSISTATTTINSFNYFHHTGLELILPLKTVIFCRHFNTKPLTQSRHVFIIIMI